MLPGGCNTCLLVHRPRPAPEPPALGTSTLCFAGPTADVRNQNVINGYWSKDTGRFLGASWAPHVGVQLHARLWCINCTLSGYTDFSATVDPFNSNSVSLSATQSLTMDVAFGFEVAGRISVRDGTVPILTRAAACKIELSVGVPCIALSFYGSSAPRPRPARLVPRRPLRLRCLLPAGSPHAKPPLPIEQTSSPCCAPWPPPQA